MVISLDFSKKNQNSYFSGHMWTAISGFSGTSVRRSYVLKNFLKFTVKHLSQSPFLIKVLG